MKLEIYNDFDVKDNTIWIEAQMIYNEDGGRDIHFYVVDVDGKKRSCGNLFQLNSNGMLELNGAVNPAFGFALNKAGQIKIANLLL